MDNDIRKRLGKSLIFRYVEEDHREKIYSESDILSFNDQETIIKEGEETHCLYLVVKGEVAVSVTERDDKEVYICTLGEGEIFGEAGIFLKTARTANVVSLGESRIMRLERDSLMEFIKKHPSTGVKILMIIIHGLLKKLRESNQELAFERKGDIDQDDVDDLVESIIAGI